MTRWVHEAGWAAATCLALGCGSSAKGPSAAGGTNATSAGAGGSHTTGGANAMSSGAGGNTMSGGAGGGGALGGGQSAGSETGGSGAASGAAGAQGGGASTEPHGLTGNIDGQPVSIPHPGYFDFVADDWWLTGAIGLGEVFYLAGSGFALEQELPIEHALFRWPEGAHDDTFFCAGAGSTLTPNNAGSRVVLRNLSRLGKCSELPAGTDAVSGDVNVTSLFTGMVEGQAYTRHSAGGRASIVLPGGGAAYSLDFAYAAQGVSSDYPRGFVSFRVATSLSATPQAMIEPYVFEAAPGTPLVVCGGGDSVASAPTATSIAFELKQATALRCPGEPIQGELEALVKSGF